GRAKTGSSRRHLLEAVGVARGIALHGLEQHVAADRAGGRAARHAVLDDHRAGIARIVDRPEADEQRVVAQVPGQRGLGDAHLAFVLCDALDRHGAGQAHHRARTPDGHHPGLAALAPAPPRAVRLLRADRQSALCLRGDRRARHGGRRDRRPDRPRRAARDHEARSVAPHRPLQEDGGAMTLSSLGLSTPAPVSFGEKIWRINWGLILVLTAIAAVGVVALYSAAGGRFDPWAGKHAMRYGVALGLCLVVALINPKVWLALAWPIYIVSM